MTKTEIQCILTKRKYQEEQCFCHKISFAMGLQRAHDQTPNKWTSNGRRSCDGVVLQ